MDDKTALIKRSTDIVALIGEYVQLDRAGNKFKGLCPFHPDTSPSLVVDPAYQTFTCWPCGLKGGDVFTFLTKIERIEFIDAKRRLAERAGISLSGDRSGSGDFRQAILRALAWAAKCFQDCLFDDRQGSAARAYLQRRGLTDETVRSHGLGYSPDEHHWLIRQARRDGILDKELLAADLARPSERGDGVYETFRGRLMFPIRNERRQVVGFGGRILASGEGVKTAKYLNSRTTEVYNKSETLYGLDMARDALGEKGEARRPVIVVEGYTDCLMAHQHGLVNTVAVCGTALTIQQLRKLRPFTDTAVLALDGDRAGRAAASKALELFLESDWNVHRAELPDGLDPCDFIVQNGVDAFRRRVDEAPDALTYELAAARGRHDFDTIEGRLRAQEELLALLAAIPLAGNTLQRIRMDAVISTLVSAIGVDENKLRRRIDELRRRRDGRPSIGQSPAAPRPAENGGQGLDADPPINRRELEVVKWLVAQPGKAVAKLREVFPVDEVRHPRLRRLAAAAFELHAEFGEAAALDQLREHLNDSALDSYVMELAAQIPDGEKFDEGLNEIAANLAVARAQSRAASVRRQLPAGAEEHDHLEMARRLGGRHEAQ